MLKKQRKEIICLKFSSFNSKQNELFKELTISKSDLIIDCSNNIPKESVLLEKLSTKKINKCFVVVISPEMQKSSSMISILCQQKKKHLILFILSRYNVI